MEKPVLVVMAAGMGSRYGGLKQLDPVGSFGEVIMDYSLYDAKKAGFEKVIFIIKHSIEKEFKEKIGAHISEHMETAYAFQDIDDLPPGYSIPEGREKPWGTCHAVLAARSLLADTPFAVINADDYYGRNAFQLLYGYLTSHPDNNRFQYCMVGYSLENTVTDHGSVSRGICETDQSGNLTSVTERTQIEKHGAGIRFTEDNGATWQPIDNGATVSMNLWGFNPSFCSEAAKRFPHALDQILSKNPLKGEYYLPSVVSELIQEGKAQVKVLKSTDRWYGITYKEDRQSVVESMKAMAEQGLYPSPLWG